ARRQVSKRYVAFVLGMPQPAAARIATLYGRHPKSRVRFSSRVKVGKPAVTTYRTTATAGGVSRLDIDLETGRTHQIRVHLAERAHAVLGDPLYGGQNLSRVTDPGLLTLAAALSHQALHAAELIVGHPISGARLELRAPLPPDLEALWARLQALQAQT